METKEELKKELNRLTVESVKLGDRIRELTETSKPYSDLMEGKETIEVVVDEESKAKYKELQKLTKIKTDVDRKRKEVWMKYQDP